MGRDSNKDVDPLVEALQRQAERQGLKQSQWAQRASVAATRISEYVRGIKQPGAARLRQLAAALGCEWKLQPRRGKGKR